MANVLPPQAQKKVWSFYRSRFLYVGTGAALMAALVALIALAPSYVYLLSTRPVNIVALQGVEIDIAKERAEASEVHSLLSEFMPVVTAKVAPVDAIEEALAKRAQGIIVSQINYDGGGEGTIVLSGTSATRESLNAFRKALEESGAYESVTVPVGDLVGSRNAQFTITLAGLTKL